MSTSDAQARLTRIFLGELDERLSTFDAGLLALEAPSSDAERAEIVTRLFRDAHSLKGAAASVGASAIEMICQRLEDTLAALRDGSRAIDDACCEGLFAAADALRAAGKTMAVPEASASPAPTPAPAAAASERIPARDATLRVGPALLDALLEQSGELLVAHYRAQALHRQIVEIGNTVQYLRDAPGKRGRERQREDLNEVHRMLDRVADAMQAERALAQRASLELDDGIRSMRVLPFGRACEGLQRVARDAAKATGKLVRLEVDGADAGVDRATIERLRDPLVHLVRNAVDHGIEPPAERTRLGKAAEGVVRLAARPKGRNFEVVVSDDGRGLDFERLRERMREAGITFDERDLARAVFPPGVSTAKRVTNLSGRGVGLDVVRTEVEALNGTIEVTTASNAGTKFALTFPLTSTTVRAIVFASGNQTFAIGAHAVGRVVRVNSANVTTVEGRAILMDAGAAIPLVSLHAVLGIPPGTADESQSVALLIGGAGRTVAVTVDALVDEREIHLRSLGTRLQGLAHVAGAAIGDDGSVVLVLRGSVLLESAFAAARAGRSSPPEAFDDTPHKRVLLVDDSVTTRTLECSILEAAGFDVITAPDGAAAWQLLAGERVDLVVSDVDMPGMDGFSLVEAIRASTALRGLPIILVTARENESDRQRGLDIGADAYIVKSSFRQEELLDAIGALT